MCRYGNYIYLTTFDVTIKYSIELKFNFSNFGDEICKLAELQLEKYDLYWVFISWTQYKEHKK